MFLRLLLLFLGLVCLSPTAHAEWRHEAPAAVSAPTSPAVQKKRGPVSTARGNFPTELASFAFLFVLLSLLVGFAGLSNPYLGLSLAATFGLFWFATALLNYPTEHAFPAIPMTMFLLSALLAILVIIQPWYVIIGVGGFFMLLLFIALIIKAARK